MRGWTRLAASDISRLDWLTNADDDARTDAAERADELEEAAPSDDVESRVGDSDPLKAIEDALRTFPADELIVVTLADEDAGRLEKGSAETALKRFALPVTHLVVENYRVDARDGTRARISAPATVYSFDLGAHRMLQAFDLDLDLDLAN